MSDAIITSFNRCCTKSRPARCRPAGTYAAKAIVRKVQGAKPLPPFKYFDKGDMAVIGRWAAVANIFGLHVSGLPAWLVWAFIHLMYLVQFQSRILVFIQWAIQDLTFNRGARLITGPAATDFDFNKAMASEESGRAAGAAGCREDRAHAVDAPPTSAGGTV